MGTLGTQESWVRSPKSGQYLNFDDPAKLAHLDFFLQWPWTKMSQNLILEFFQTLNQQTWLGWCFVIC